MLPWKTNCPKKKRNHPKKSEIGTRSDARVMIDAHTVTHVRPVALTQACAIIRVIKRMPTPRTMAIEN